MNEAGVLNDDGILTLAESVTDKKLQCLLIYLVELSIELEGWKFVNNEICLTRERKKNRGGHEKQVMGTNKNFLIAVWQ